MTKTNVPRLRFREFNDEWKEEKLGNVVDYEQPTQYIVKSTEYSNDFTVPVLTAGKNFLLGYTNEKNVKKCSEEDPIIIFDDFTTGSHYVTFDFMVKSSAMKLLKSNNDNDSYFMYCILKGINYVPTSHSRQWISNYANFTVNISNIHEQNKISLFLRKMDKIIELQTQNLEQLKKLKRGYLQKMFPQDGESVPRLRFSGFSGEWKEEELGNVVLYEQPTKYIVKSNEYSNEFNVPVLTAGKNFLLGYTNELENVKEASETNPLIIFDDFTTSSHYVNFSFKIKSSAMKFLKATHSNDTYFMYCVLENINYFPATHSRQWISNYSKMTVRIPNCDEQNRISSFLKKIDQMIKYQSHKIESLKQQKKAYLQKMFI